MHLADALAPGIQIESYLFVMFKTGVDFSGLYRPAKSTGNRKNRSGVQPDMLRHLHGIAITPHALRAKVHARWPLCEVLSALRSH